MNVLADQELAADHQTRLSDGLRDYDNQWIEDERMARELAQRFEADRQAKEAQITRLLDTAFQSEQRLLCTIESGTLNDDHIANCAHAAVQIARLRGLVMEMTR